MKEKAAPAGAPAPRLAAVPRMHRSAAYAREIPLVDGAIALVAGGAFPRVTLVSLTGGLHLARAAAAHGREAGVTVRAMRRAGAPPGGRGAMDLVVERDG
jgi:hypothetical protein